MTSDRRRCAAVLALLALIDVAVFVPPNRTGTADVNMLGAFEVDEFAQYHALWRMTNPAESPAAALRQFVAYDYYSYGFPFFAPSALAFWPLRSAYTGSGTPGLTAASMLVLRELSPLFHALSILILVGLWTGFRSTGRAAALFVFLAALPAVVEDSMWWHPDAWVTFFVVATIAALVRDRLRLGRWFYAAAAACGLAIATKLVGLWFFAAIALHLLRALPGRSPRAVALHGAGFAAAMSLAVLAASPMLFVPGELAKVGELQSWIRSITAFGWGERGESGLAAWYPTLQSGYGGATTLALLVALGGITAARDRERRDLALAILAWTLPLCAYVIFGTSMQTERYLLPALLPLASCAGSAVWLDPLCDAAAPRRSRAAAAAVAIALAVQLAQFARADADRYRDVLEREQTSGSLAFYQRLEREVIAPLAPRTRLRILLTPEIYVTPDPRFEVHLRWGGIVPDDLRDADPDLVLVSRQDLAHFGDPARVDRSYDVPRAQRRLAFYRDAAQDALPGYRRLFATDFAVAFGRVAPDFAVLSD